MRFRRKHSEQSEVFTDSLNDILFILLMFFLIVATLANPNVIRVGLPKGSKDTKAKQHIMVSIDRNQQFYLGTTPLASDRFEAALTDEIRRFRSLVDTPTVVINADTTAYYGEVYQIMLLAKKEKAKVVARIE
ncbi:MAG: biopolymer transporter ExbD [Sphingomonadales bacterium]|nr:biopolymer transporter ExbD [Sphingomonadales bacterium]